MRDTLGRAVLFRRPKVSVVGPAQAAPGDKVTFEVHLLCEKESRVRALEIGLESLCWLSGAAQRTFIHRLFDWQFVDQQLILPAGDTVLPRTFTVPMGALPTLTTRSFGIGCSLYVNVLFRVLPPLRSRYPLRVTPSLQQPPRSPSLPLLNPGPNFEIECALDDRYATQGGEISGRLAFIKVPARAYEVRITLSTHVRTPHATYTKETLDFVVLDRAPLEGTSMPFRLSVPHETPIDVSTPKLEISHVMAVGVGSAHTRNGVRVFVLSNLVSRPPKSDALGQDAPLGQARRGLIWREAAKRTGWMARDGSLSAERTICGCDVVAGRSGTGEFTATFRFSDLGLGLTVEPMGAFTRLLRDVVIVERFAFNSRDQRQLVAGEGNVVSEFGVHLAPLSGLAMDDHHATLKQQLDTDGVEDLVAFLKSLEAFAEALEHFRAHVPPPPGLADLVPTWERLNATLRGQIVIGSLSIENGSLGRTPVSLKTTFAGKGPRGLRIVAVVENPADGLADLDGPNVTARARLMAQELKTFGSLYLEENRLVLGVRGFDDPLPLLERLARLAEELTNRTAIGPYR